MKGTLKDSITGPTRTLLATMVLTATQPAKVFVPVFQKVTFKETPQQSRKQPSEARKKKRCYGRHAGL